MGAGRPCVGLHRAGLGAALVLLYTGFISSADAITKLLSGGYAAPQVYALSGAMVVGLSLLADRHRSQRRGLGTCCPQAMLLRSVATVLAAVSFFYAFRLLPFAQVFLFIGLMPLLAGLMSAAVLGEYARPSAWVALMAGFAGVLFLFPTGIDAITFGHLVAFSAALFGTFSMVMARYICRYEVNALAQVFYPNLAICLSMGLVAPLVWSPMPLIDLAWIGGYAVALFAARWLLVVALGLLPTHVVTPLMNLQFAWMALIGMVAFGEYPAAGTLLGVTIVISSGLFLVWDQLAPSNQPRWFFRPRRRRRLS